MKLRFVKAFGDLSVEENLQVAWGDHMRESSDLPVEAEQAVVVGEDAQGYLVVLLNKLGKGKAIVCTYAIEYLLLNRPAANLETKLHSLYRGGGFRGCDRSQVRGQASASISRGPAERVGERARCYQSDASASSLHAARSISGRATVDLKMKSKGVRLFTFENQSWSPFMGQE